MAGPRTRRPAPAADFDDDPGWLEVDERGGWRPTLWTRVRAGLLILAGMGALLLVAVSFPSGGPDDDEPVVAASTTTTTTVVESTTTTLELAPDSVGGVAPSLNCLGDDRNAQPLRDRVESTVVVLNGTSRAGHAGDVTAILRQLGYTALAPDNAGRRGVSRVEFTAGFCAEAEVLAVDLGLFDAEIVPAPTQGRVAAASLVLTLGADSL